MRSRATSSMLRMAFFSILTSCDSLRARSGPKAPAVFLRKAWPNDEIISHWYCWIVFSPEPDSAVSGAFRALALPGRSGSARSGSFSFAPPIPQTPRDRDRSECQLLSLTQATLSEPAARFGSRHWWWRVFDLRGGRHARLAHRIGTMHSDGSCR